MDCRRAQEAISARMDGERLPLRVLAGVDEHVDGCVACQRFTQAAWKLRERVRFEVAPAVPDLTERIMAAVETEVRTQPRRLRLVRGPRELRPRRPLMPRLAPAVAALLVGALVGSLTVGGPWRDRPGGSSQVAAADVARGVAAAAPRLTAYEAQFAITEYNLAPDVPVRELSMHVWFRAPERFRLDVVDHTSYPASVTPTDLRLVVNGSTWYASAPAPCPTTSCPPRETVVTNRVPYSSQTPVPSDLVLPITALATDEQVAVVGRGTLLDRDAIQVELPFDRAEPLFPFLSLGGRWRPFFPSDRVALWLDAESFFPLRWQVFPAGGRERDEWSLRFGLPEEPSRRPIFEVTALSVSEQPPALPTFRIPAVGSSQDQGARPVSLAEVPAETGFEPVTPQEVADLDLYQVVLPPAPEEPAATESIITYSKGLSWLQVGETRSWVREMLFGPVGLRAEEVSLPNGGVAYYEPADAAQGRRLSIHAAGTDLYVETNLPRDELLRVAASLPVLGVPIPEAWRLRVTPEGVAERVTIEEATGQVPFAILLPATLPAGYAFASAELIRVGGAVGVNAYFQPVDVALGTGVIRLHAEAATELPPASAAVQSTVTVRSQIGRWTPERARLEWVEGGAYYSVDAPGLDLAELLAIAASLEPIASEGNA